MALKEDIVAAVSKEMGVTIPELYAESRSRKPVADARQVAMWCLYHVSSRNAAAAARVFSRDQSTGRHAVWKVNRDPKLKRIGKTILERFVDATSIRLYDTKELVEAPKPKRSAV